MSGDPYRQLKHPGNACCPRHHHLRACPPGFLSSIGRLSIYVRSRGVHLHHQPWMDAASFRAASIEIRSFLAIELASRLSAPTHMPQASRRARYHRMATPSSLCPNFFTLRPPETATSKTCILPSLVSPVAFIACTYQAQCNEQRNRWTCTEAGVSRPS